jgi:hypothetical protein
MERPVGVDAEWTETAELDIAADHHKGPRKASHMQVILDHRGERI